MSWRNRCIDSFFNIWIQLKKIIFIERFLDAFTQRACVRACVCVFGLRNLPKTHKVAKYDGIQLEL